MRDETEAVGRPARAPASSFGVAMRLLPAHRRAAMCAIHAFRRAVDDIADGPAPPAVRRAALERWRADSDG